MLITLLIAVTLASAVAGSAWRLSRIRIRRRVLVSLVDGKALNGVLWSRGARLLVLKDAVLLTPAAEPTRVDGTVVIDRRRVEFVQVLP